MLHHPEAAPEASDATALGLITTFAARGWYGDLWDAFLDHTHLLRTESPAALSMLGQHLSADRAAQDSLVAAVWLWIRRRIERVPSQESLGIARLALEKIRRQPTGQGPAQQLRDTGAELVILVSTASYEAAADAADALWALLPRLSAGQQVERAAGIRHLLDLAVDAYIGACRLNDAEIALDTRGYTTTGFEAREVRSTRAFLHAMRGDTAAAKALLDDIPDRPRAQVHRELPPPHLAGEMPARERIARAAVLFENGALEQAVALLGDIEPQYPGIVEWPFAAFMTARMFTATDPTTGMEHLQRLLHKNRNVPTSRRLQHLLRSAVVDLSLAANDVPMAQRMLKEVDPRDHLLRISAARLSLITCDPDATRDLTALLALPDLWPQTRAQALLVLAVHLHRAGRTDEAQDALRRAVAITSALKATFFQSLAPRSDLHEIAGSTDTGLPTDLSTAGHLDTALTSIRLTKRESILLAWLGSGSTLSEIAAAEFVTLSTVKSQATSLYRKLDVNSRHDAVEVARRRGLLG